MDNRGTYTHGHHESVLRSHRWRTVENSAAYLIPHLRPGTAVLDVGCGPGTITLDMARRVAPGRVLGVDNADEPLSIARAEADEVPNAAFDRADVYALPYSDAAFDVVHAHQVLQHLADPAAALAEMRRVCRPGGVVAVREADFGGMAWYPRVPGLESWLRLYYEVARGNNGEPDGGRMLKAWARAAGFTDISCTASAWCFASDEERAWWGGLWADRVRVSSFAGQALDRGLASQAELDEVAAAWNAWTESEDGWFAVPNAEIICRV